MSGGKLQGLELSGMRALVALERHGTLLGAARALSTSRGTLRRRLSQLEEAVGVSLYVQGDDGVHLTTAGTVLVDHTRRLLTELGGAIEDVHAAADAPVRALRLLFPDGMPPTIVVAGLSAVMGQNPGLMLDMDCAPDPLALDFRNYDLVVHFGDPPARGYLVTRELMAVPEALVATQDYLDRNGVPASPDELVHHTLLSWKPPGEPTDHWVTGTGASVPVAPTIISSDIHFIRQLALAGQGIARLVEGNVPAPGEPALVPVLPDHFHRRISVRLLLADGLQRTPRMRQAIEVLRQIGIDLGITRSS